MPIKHSRLKKKIKQKGGRDGLRGVSAADDLNLVEYWANYDSAILGNLVDVFAESEDELVKTLANRTFFTVVLYDISNNRRRSRVAKILLGYGDRVQYSGFEAHLTSKQIDRLTHQIEREIDQSEDRVRIYRIAGAPCVTFFGAIPLFEDEDFTII